ncbi:MAG: 23S rRNA (adenine(2030)-N(6))-methyltransferase RlmJ [Alphaproteobacteria bacterium]
MNYRHIFHAGNFADVLKHVVLVAVLLHLRKKEKPFAVFDSHAGAGLYELSNHMPARTGEAAKGIITLLPLTALPSPLAEYCDIVRGFDGRYPGSPLLAAKLLRPQDRLVAIELHPEDAVTLKSVLARFPRTRTINGDGYRELKGLLPPPERRGVVLLDPPYESEDEFAQAACALADFHRRFATGVYLFWYPVKSRSHAETTAGEILNSGIGDLLRIELDIDAQPGKRHQGQGQPLSAAGLLVVNAPYGLERDLSAILPLLTEKLAQGPRARFRLERLAGEPG